MARALLLDPGLLFGWGRADLRLQGFTRSLTQPGQMEHWAPWRRPPPWAKHLAPRADSKVESLRGRLSPILPQGRGEGVALRKMEASSERDTKEGTV